MPLPLLLLFDKYATEYPFNCALYSDDIVMDRAKYAKFEVKTAAVAELLVRYFLSRHAEYRSVLDSALGDDVVARFTDLCDNRVSGAAIPLANIYQVIRNDGEQDSFNDHVARIVKKRFDFLFSADGFIPVIGGDDGYLIPFALEKTSGNQSVVVDINGEEQKDWSEALRSLPEPGKKAWRVRVAVSTKVSGDGLDLVGRSLMLPLQMAIWRKNNKLPCFNSLSVISTGAFDGNGRLDYVDVAEKIKTVETKLKNGVLIFPTSGKYCERDRLVELPAGHSAEEILVQIRPYLEWKFETDAVYAITRLNRLGLCAEVELSRYGRWGEAAQRLENLLSSVDRLENPDEYLAYLMLLSMAKCHAGDTSGAFMWNARARKFADGLGGYELQLARLQVDLLVMLTDNEEYDAILNNAVELESGGLKKLRDGQDERAYLDTEMRFCGTMGQAYAYGVLAGRTDCSSAKSREYLRRAFMAAKKLHDMGADDEEKDNRRCDMAHDANYLHLWDVFFAPDESSESFHDAERQYSKIANEGGKRKNYIFLMRQRALGWYREILRTSMVDSLESKTRLDGIVRECTESETVYSELLADDNVEKWIRATISKYLGAIYAAAGNFEKALRFFRNASLLLDESLKKYNDSVIAKIYMTVCAEACRSLSKCGTFAAETEAFKAKGLEYFASHAGDAPWCAYLEAMSSDFPGLGYWY